MAEACVRSGTEHAGGEGRSFGTGNPLRGLRRHGRGGESGRSATKEGSKASAAMRHPSPPSCRAAAPHPAASGNSQEIPKPRKAAGFVVQPLQEEGSVNWI